MTALAVVLALASGCAQSEPGAQKPLPGFAVSELQRQLVDDIRAEEWFSPIHERVLADYVVTAAELQEADYLRRACEDELMAGVPYDLHNGQRTWILDDPADLARREAAEEELVDCFRMTAMIRSIYDLQREEGEPVPAMVLFRECLTDRGLDLGRGVPDAELSAFMWNNFEDNAPDTFREQHPEAAACRDAAFTFD